MRMQLLYEFGDDDTPDERAAIIMGPERALELGIVVERARDHIRQQLKYGELDDFAERLLEVVAEILSEADTDWIE